MNVEKLNVTELSSEELVKISGGQIVPITDRDVWNQVFRVKASAYNKLVRAALS